MAASHEDKVAASGLQNAITRSDSGNNEKGITGSISNTNADSASILVDRDNADQLRRHLTNRHIQLIAIGGSIGTALFISIGTGLERGGPASLLIGYTLHSIMVGFVNNGMAEMCTYMPVTGSFIRMAGKWVDESFGFMAGWNFFLYEAFLIPFEISALNLVLTFWRDDIPAAAVCVGCIVLYGLLNVVAVKYFGEAEFWLASGKLLLIAIAFCFTFITMVGGNPQRDAYGFRTWQNPGAFATYINTGDLGRFQGLLASIFSAGFTVVGPEYISMVAGEAMRPRIYLKQGFKTVYWRFGVFFIGSAIAIGIIIPYNDPKLENAGTGTAEGSPYVIAMQNMGISVLPHVINALLCTSIFSAGNAYTYCAMRCLYGLALDGQAPGIFKKCLKNGIPIYAFGITMFFPFLSFLQVSNNTAQVVTWLQSLTQAAQLLNYVVISVVYVFFYKACNAQGLDRKTLPYYGYFQPYCAYIAIVWMTFMVTCFGYTTFLPGRWDTLTFFSYYTMIFVGIATFSTWKLLKRTRFIPATEADLIWDKPIIDAYEAQFTEPPTRFRDDIRKILGWKKNKQANEE
ncbi:general amino acid permease agp2 [Colletotrichum tofieldiae]|uniref:General amino acid permease agp2 (Histidine permease) n=1 Tax=Colletotrichum tofieldiae TaxID=708197 RepID=A0A166NX72_9PEZI|nr:general amino acid permease agp2 (histidine permease) [Colletotrichum tofieldiae]GKT52678.1 general amino acid permease agp2 [Colletotrichum tofieldiae]GKT81869.1 general amino acid permease agp2 [Colletotrichum tofieldiae]GKT89052.1 general amino acid permease agp2 [Colletotrichum tofieldiae]